MKSNLAKVSLALLSAVFILSCQDGLGPVEPGGLEPQFNKPDASGEHDHGGGGEPDPGTLFVSGPIGAGYNCADGATNTGGPSFGTVNFNQPRDDSHMHANVQLRGAPQGDYDIFGNQELVCLVDPTLPDLSHTWVDFDLRRGHATTVTVGANGKGKARIGLDFGGVPAPLPKINAPLSHAPGPHQLWVTLVGTSNAATGVVLRSTAVEVVIPEHEGHP